MTQQEIYSGLLKYKGTDRLELIRADYKGTNEGFKERILSVYDKIKQDYLFKYYERLNDLCMILDKVEYENDLDRIKIIEGQIKSHERTLLDPFLMQLNEEIENYFNIPLKTDEEPNYKRQNLFKVGLLFATGQMNKYFEVGKENRIISNTKAPAISRDFENIGISVSNKFILASINEYKSNKNIFNSYDMMTNVINHCKAENIPIEPFFMRKYSIIEYY